jgi:hypothetical protein
MPLTTDDFFSFEPNVGCETNEPSLREILVKYYRAHFSDERAEQLVQRYMAAMAMESVRKLQIYMEQQRALGTEKSTS